MRELRRNQIQEDSPQLYAQNSRRNKPSNRQLQFLIISTVIVSIGCVISYDYHFVKKHLSLPISQDSKIETEIKQEEVKIQQLIVRPKLQGADLFNFTVVRRIDRSKKDLYYTQGLVFANDTTLIESAGLYRKSAIQSIDIDKAQSLQQSTKNELNIFGEGCDIIGDKIYQLTWQEKIIYFYDTLNLQLLGNQTQPKEMREGWGITHRVIDQTQIFLSDGTNNLYWAHENLTVFKTTPIFYPDGTPASSLNELEFSNGLIYANVYLSSIIIAIDPDTLAVVKIYDMKQLLNEVTQTVGFKDYLYKQGNCLNGIAFYKPNNTFWVTGKLWPFFWEVKFE